MLTICISFKLLRKQLEGLFCLFISNYQSRANQSKTTFHDNGQLCWGCDFYELKVNGEISEGAPVAFTKKGWDFVEKEDFQNYYSGNNRLKIQI